MYQIDKSHAMLFRSIHMDSLLFAQCRSDRAISTMDRLVSNARLVGTCSAMEYRRDPPQTLYSRRRLW